MKETMPTCPRCNDSRGVTKCSVISDQVYGTHYCWSSVTKPNGKHGCGEYFTLPAVSVSLTKPVALPAEGVQYKTLSPEFLNLMEEIGMYGLEKYGDASMEAKFRRGDFSRCERTKAREIAKHSANHFDEYLDGIVHDKFGTRRHQLAACAFNAMMEYIFHTKGEKN